MSTDLKTRSEIPALAGDLAWSICKALGIPNADRVTRFEMELRCGHLACVSVTRELNESEVGKLEAVMSTYYVCDRASDELTPEEAALVCGKRGCHWWTHKDKTYRADQATIVDQVCKVCGIERQAAFNNLL